MIQGKRICVVIPAGRQRTMAILIDNLRRFRNQIDEVQLWLNCPPENKDDIAWIKSLAKSYGDWVTIKEYPPNESVLKPVQLNTGLFYRYCTNEDTLYFRFDDDIVYVDDAYFKNMVAFKVANPDYFLVFGNIWNNAYTSWIHQFIGNIDKSRGVVEELYCMDQVGWQDGDFAVHIHRLLQQHVQDGTTSQLFFDHHDLDGRRFSISNFCVAGSDLAAFGGIIPERDEEIWLTETYVDQTGKQNVICGSALVAHYSFFAQRDALNKTDILDTYKRIAQQKLSGAYYRLLGEAS